MFGTGRGVAKEVSACCPFLFLERRIGRAYNKGEGVDEVLSGDKNGESMVLLFLTRRSGKLGNLWLDLYGCEEGAKTI